MRLLPYLLALLLAWDGALSLVRAQDQAPLSFQVFYDGLAHDGTWIQTDDYGYVFQPNVTDPAWAPYTDGHWLYSDAGWTWVSDESWGWATYHYGRWANLNDYGWVWVPGYQWAPAWVSWRYGGSYVGWAPLPPETIAGADYVKPGGNPKVAFHFGGDVDVSFNIGAGCYNFMHSGDLGEPNCRPFVVNRYNNYAIINRTTNITNVTVNRQPEPGASSLHGVTAYGPPLNEVNGVPINAFNAHSRRHVPTVKLIEALQPGKDVLQGNSLAVYAPRIDRQPAPQARPAQADQTLTHPTLNRGTSISHPMLVNVHLQPPAPTAQVIRQVEEAQAKTPKHAKVAPQSSAEPGQGPQESSKPSSFDQNRKPGTMTPVKEKPLKVVEPDVKPHSTPGP